MNPKKRKQSFKNICFSNFEAFALAEMIVVICIIGIIAAVTISAFIYHINDKVFGTKRKTLLIRMNNAISQMEELSGFGDKNNLADSASYDFITKGFSKVYKIGKICRHDNISECDIPEKIKQMDGKTEVNFPKTLKQYEESAGYYEHYYKNSKTDPKITAFQTINGDSVVIFYNSGCNNKISKYGDNERFKPNICAHFVYDLNGKNSPNQIGKDIGIITAIYGKDELLHVVSPKVYEKGIIGTGSFNNGDAICKSKDKNLRLPTLEEAGAISMTTLLYGFWNKSFITDSIVANDLADRIWLARNYSGTESGFAKKISKDTEANIICVYEFNYQ